MSVFVLQQQHPDARVSIVAYNTRSGTRSCLSIRNESEKTWKLHFKIARIKNTRESLRIDGRWKLFCYHFIHTHMASEDVTRSISKLIFNFQYILADTHRQHHHHRHFWLLLLLFSVSVVAARSLPCHGLCPWRERKTCKQWTLGACAANFMVSNFRSSFDWCWVGKRRINSFFSLFFFCCSLRCRCRHRSSRII